MKRASPAAPAYWVTPPAGMLNVQSEYPATLARDCIAAVLARIGIDLRPLSAHEAVDTANAGPAVFLFSSTTAEWPRVRRLAAQIRAASPHAVLIAGGYHVSALPDDEGTELFDYVVVGEGEQAIQHIFAELNRDGRPRSGRNGKTITRAPRIRNLDALPLPRRSPGDVAASRLNGLMTPTASKQTGAAALLLSRGCNHRCSFCASHTIWGDKLITRQVEPIADEMSHVAHDLKANAIALVDQSFGQDADWTERLCRRLRGFDAAKWSCMAKTSFPRRLLPDLAAAGCVKIGFGIEAVDLEHRRRLRKPAREGLDELNALFRACNDAGILTKAYLMIGYPWETRQHLRETTKRFLEHLETNDVKIAYFTPFPGTLDWQRYSDRLATRDWQYFDTDSVPVVENPQMSPDEIVAIRDELFRAFYSSDAHLDACRTLLHKHPHFREPYVEFARTLGEYGTVLSAALTDSA